MTTLYIVEIVLAAIAVVLIAAFAIPQSRKAILARLGAGLGKAYQKHLGQQVKAKFPDLYARFSGFKLGPESQGSLASAMKRIPPQEALKLQAEFMRLSDNFLARHPELATFVSAMKAQDARGQAKALDAILRLPSDQRQTISKDLLWAYDQLVSRFPRWMKLIESVLRPLSD